MIGIGGVVAATSIAINSGSAISLGAGYTTATSCDENVTLKAKTALDVSSGQLYVAAIELSDISQNSTTGCGNKTMELALKINGQMTYASWDIPASDTDSTFNFSAATISLSDYNAMTALSPFQVDGLSNIALGQIGSFTYNNTYNWRPRGSSLKWMDIASSSDGRKLVATDFGANANGGHIYTSTDSGATWTQRGLARNWKAIASSSDGTNLVTADYPDFNWDEPDRGYIYTSSDSGVTWDERKGAGSKWWQSFASSSDGRKLAAVAWGDYIYTSTDYGVTWVPRKNDVPREWQDIASSSDGTKLVATDRGNNPGYGFIYTSTDSGVTWTQRGLDRNWRSVTSSADGKTLAAVVYPRSGAGAGGYIFTSTDYGVTWTEQITAGQKWWQCITSSSDGTKFAAGEWYGKIWTSIDSGVTWAEQNNSEQLIWTSIASSADGSKLVAVDNGWGSDEYWELPGGYIYTGVSGKTRSNN